MTDDPNSLIKLASNSKIQVLKYDKKTRQYFLSDGRPGAEKTDIQYIIYLNGKLCDVTHVRWTESLYPMAVYDRTWAVVYDKYARLVSGAAPINIEYCDDADAILAAKYIKQAARRTGRRAIDGDAIVHAYKIAATNPICNRSPGDRNYVAGGSGENVWLGGADNSGVEYGYERHMFTPAEYEIVSKMLHRAYEMGVEKRYAK